ncbi:MAG: hypothetical protein AAFQ67_05750, partial [Pseudomonadota bacterium]
GLLQGATAVTAVAGTAAGLAPQAFGDTGNAGNVLAQNPSARIEDAQRLRRRRARVNALQAPITPQPINDDETRFPDFIGNFSKSLKHNRRGEVVPSSYKAYLNALASRDPAQFDAIPVGRENDPQRVRLVSPQAAFAFELSGLDGNASRVPAAPSFDSAVTEAEMAELYWYSVTRDVPFSEYENRGIIRRAAEDLNRFSRSDIFPRINGAVTPASVFRGGLPFAGIQASGVLDGPFVSQFLLQPFQIGQLVVEQRYPKLERGNANQFMTEFPEWLAIQRGFDPNAAQGGNASTFTNRTKFIARMRDLSEWVHRDFPVQSPLHAFSVILGFGTDDAFDPNLPYGMTRTNVEQGFASFGLADISGLTVLGPRQALTGAWFQKWAAHRRLRPEVYGARINVQLRGERDYGIAGELLGSEAFSRAVDEVRSVNQTPGDSSNDGLLPMGFPEGSPAHPAYPGGHSSFVAAGATILKAFANEDFVIPNPVVANRNGSELLSYVGTPLTIGGELNKLVANVTHARDAAGMHWRSDGVGNLIGEAVGIATLADYSETYNEAFDGFTLTKFDGQRIRIRNGRVFSI